MVINLTSEKLKSIQIKIKTGSYEKVEKLAKTLKDNYKININKNELLGNLAEEALQNATFNLNGETLTCDEILNSVKEENNKEENTEENKEE